MRSHLFTRESAARAHAQKLIEGHVCKLPGVKINTASRFFMGEVLEAIGDGTCYTLDNRDDFVRIAKLVKHALAGHYIHPGAVRFFEADARIVVRNPDCDACGEPYAQHIGPDGKCPFASTNYRDDAR